MSLPWLALLPLYLTIKPASVDGTHGQELRGQASQQHLGWGASVLRLNDAADTVQAQSTVHCEDIDSWSARMSS